MTTNAPEKTILPSYAKGEWQSAEDPQKTAEVFDANTGELITHVSSDGVDIAGMVDYARTVSCYQADTQGAACGRCDACRLRSQGFSDAGLADPTRYQKSG